MCACHLCERVVGWKRFTNREAERVLGQYKRRVMARQDDRELGAAEGPVSPKERRDAPALGPDDQAEDADAEGLFRWMDSLLSSLLGVARP